MDQCEVWCYSCVKQIITTHVIPEGGCYRKYSLNNVYLGISVIQSNIASNSTLIYIVILDNHQIPVIRI